MQYFVNDTEGTELANNAHNTVEMAMSQAETASRSNGKQYTVTDADGSVVYQTSIEQPPEKLLGRRHK